MNFDQAFNYAIKASIKNGYAVLCESVSDSDLCSVFSTMPEESVELERDWSTHSEFYDGEQA